MIGLKEHFKYMKEAMETIKKKHNVETEWDNPSGKNKDAKGTIECPKCKGVLHYSIAGYNGHIWGGCETKDCLRWMQ